MPHCVGIIAADHDLEIKCLLRSRLISCVHGINDSADAESKAVAPPCPAARGL